MWKKILLAVGAIVVIAAGVMAWKIGPSNIIGMIRYDQRQEGDLKVGDRAPDTQLVALDGKQRVSLFENRTAGKPMVIVLGSFTWPPFRRSVDRLVKMHARYRDRVDFQTVYIREAHPLDEWQMESNVKEDVCYRQPRSLQERVNIANDFVKRFKYSMPLVVDTMDDHTEKLYAGWPERFYILDPNGVIVYKGEPGPFGFHPEEVEQWLAKNAG